MSSIQETAVGVKILRDRNKLAMRRPDYAKLCRLSVTNLKLIEEGTRRVQLFELYEIAKRNGNRMEDYMGKPNLETTSE